MPTIPSITTSVENQQYLIIDSHAKYGFFQKDARGRLLRYTGGFTVVYPYISGDGEKWAFRCWHAELHEDKHRFELISEAIQKANLRYLCEFYYSDKGINVDGRIYPTTRMRWVEGQTLKNYICKNYTSRNRILFLAESFMSLIKDMHLNSFSHGDLQHGNIIVGNDERLYLVDYDSFYCPELKDQKDIITGLQDYQHPARKKNKSVSEKLDYFSEIIIYTSILGLAYNPSLLKKYKVEDSEHLLFEKTDFENIKQSNIFKDLWNLDPKINVLLDIIVLYLSKNDINELEAFDVILERKIEPLSIQKLGVSTQELNDDELLIVTWETKGAKYVTLNGTRVPACGSKEILATDEIVLKASNEFKRTEKKLGIRVLHKMKIQDFSVNSNIIEEGEFCTISWNAINVRSIKFDGNDLSGKNQYSFIPTVSRRYIIEFDGFDGTIINKEFKITLKEPTPIISLDFPDSLYVGDTAIVKWRAKNIDKVIVDGKEFKAHGEYQYAFNDIDKVLYFYFRGKLVETRTIKINKLMPEKPIINSFSADKTEIYEGDAIDLSWNYTHGEKCFLNSQPITSKSFHETLNSDKTYVLKVINRTEITQKTLFVKVLKKPTIRLSTDKNEIDKNFESEVNIRWQVFDAYSISMVTPSGTYNIGQNGTKSLKIKDTTIITIKAIGLDRKTEFCQELCIKAKEVKKYCTKCGRQYILAPDKNFCIHCGQKLSGGKKSFFNLF